jgi:hypothetical protein
MDNTETSADITERRVCRSEGVSPRRLREFSRSLMLRLALHLKPMFLYTNALKNRPLIANCVWGNLSLTVEN